MKPSSLFLIAFTFLSLGVYAHGPTPQKIDESIVINASIEKTWAVVKNFDKISTWHPDVTSSKGDGKNESNGVRTLTLSDGDIVESLDFYSEKGHEYIYRLETVNTDALPASSYSFTFQLIAEGDKTLVNWKGRAYRGDTATPASEQLNDESLIKAMNTFFKNGLKGLKEAVE